MWVFVKTYILFDFRVCLLTELCIKEILESSNFRQTA